MKVVVIRIVIGTLGTVTKSLIQRQEYLEIRSWDYHIYQPLRPGRIWHKINF